VAAASTILPDSPMKTLPATLGFLAGMPLYALGGPATHWTHGDFIKGVVSLAGNFVIPAVSGVIGQSVRCAPSDAADDCGSRGFFSGFAIALVTVPIVDALVLGWEDIPDDDVFPDSVLPADPSNGGKSAPSSGGISDASGAEGDERETRESGVRRPRRVPSRTPLFSVAPAWHFGPRGEFGVGVAGRF
jgi:hypothetical protein